MEEEISKSQRKRDADALQKIGVTLIGWSIDKLDALPLPEHLKQAIIDAKSLKSHGAIRRQAQLIGKLMRTSEVDELIAAYHAAIADDNAETAQFHDLEVWRAQLIDEGRDALTRFVDTYHPDDLQHLKQLIKKAVDEKTKGQPTGASRALFRYIRSCVK